MATRSKAKTEIETTEETTAQVIETQNGNGQVNRTIKYEAKVKPNVNATETDDETTDSELDNDSETANLSFSQSDFQEIPKDKIDVIFDDLENDFTAQDYFYAKLTRIPDAMQDKFFVSCPSEMPLGVFQFGLQDRFSFIPAIQERNNNSGGRFNIAIFNSEQKQISVFIGYDNPFSSRKEPIYKPVGAVNVLIPNPVKQDIATDNNGQSEVRLILEAMREQHREFMLALQNNKPQQSEIEKLLLTKAVDMLTNPPQNQNSGLEDKMMNFMMMPQLVDRMAKKMFPDAPPPVVPSEPTTFDRILQLSQTPIAQNLLERLGDLSEAIVMSKIAPPPAMNNPQNETNDEQENTPEQLEQGEPISEDMKAILTELVAELESNSEINESNPTIVKLKAEHADAFETVATLCKVTQFEGIFQILLTQANKIQPYPFEPFLNATRDGFNERGNKAIERLKLVYEYLKTS